MNKYINCEELIEHLVGVSDGWRKPLGYTIEDEIRRFPPADVKPTDDIENAVDEVIRILNAIYTSGRLNYGDYCELHDVISDILNT